MATVEQAAPARGVARPWRRNRPARSRPSDRAASGPPPATTTVQAYTASPVITPPPLPPHLPPEASSRASSFPMVTWVQRPNMPTMAS
jgi:hypothetical protein